MNKNYKCIALLLLWLVSSVCLSGQAQAQDSLAWDEKISDQVDALIEKMTLEEKCSQMKCIWNTEKNILFDEEGKFSPTLAKSNLKTSGDLIGQIARPGDYQSSKEPKEHALLTNSIQKFFIENSRLGIPVLFHDECLHGHVSKHATCFPQPIALASTFDTDLVYRINRVTATEARATGIHQALSPVLDVARDPRWGRVEETFGEDPYLVSELGLSAVKGLQGDKGSKKNWLVATLKHFAAHSQPESGNNCAPLSISERHLREIFLSPFKKAVTKGNVSSVMASYNEIDGVPSHMSRWLLGEVLRDEWGFKGSIVSDYYAIRELAYREGGMGHHVAGNTAECAQLAINAGVNCELPYTDCYGNLSKLVTEGIIKEEVIDDLIRPILYQKYELGLFDDPYVDPAIAESVVGCQEHKDLAYEAALKSIVLLKNSNKTLPLDSSKLKRILVVGPNADRVLLGGYSGTPLAPVTLLEGIRNKFGSDIEILHEAGCNITIGGSWQEDKVVVPNQEEERKLIEQAVLAAKGVDVIIVALGGNEQTSREAWSPNHLGDRTNLQLVGLQDELVNALSETGLPMVAVLHNGKPLAINNLNEKADAILECWYLGQSSGDAVADILLGNKNPSGKLPITFPRSVGHIPAFYNFRPSARRGYLFDNVEPLFPFGFGLSYTEFELSEAKLDNADIKVGESTNVKVTVKNVGQVAGSETVQLYINDSVSSITRPVIELKGVAKVQLEPGESKEVTIPITPESLSFWNIDKRFETEPGTFKIYVSTDSRVSDFVELKVQ